MSEHITFGWNDKIPETDSTQFELVNGVHEFKVTGFERSHFDGSGKIPPCNCADITLMVITQEGGRATVNERLFLYDKMVWKINAFFRSIGLDAGDWDHMMGKRGRASFKPRTYTNREGEERQANNVYRYLKYDSSKMSKDSDLADAGQADMASGSMDQILDKDADLPF